MTNPATALLIAGATIVVACVLFWPRSGLILRWAARLRKTERVLLEDALKHLYDDEYHGRTANLNSVAGVLGIPRNRAATLATRMEEAGLITSGEAGFRLTDEGRSHALRVIRIHRLWERYLADHSGLAQTDWHERAERLEHTTTIEQADALAARLGHPRFDPHGDPIPTASGEIAPPRGGPLTGLQPGDNATVVHVEDEPEEVYAELVAEGIEPGMSLHLLDSSREGVRLELDGKERVLAPVVARNVSVVLLDAPAEVSDREALSTLAPGESATVVDISRACYGPQRRRLLDLGLLPGTPIRAEFSSPSGDPMAYRIRGAAIALRRDQADLVRIERSSSGA